MEHFRNKKVKFWLKVPCSIAPTAYGKTFQPEPGLATVGWSVVDTGRD